jgi:cell division protein ZapA
MSEAEAPRGVAVRILERDYQVACPPEEREHLLDTAAFLNARMKEIRDGGKVSGADRIAVMAALNIAGELLRLRDRDHSLQNEAGARVRALRERVEAALQNGQQLEL